MELMMTLAVVAIIAAIATPSFRGFLQNIRITGASNDLLTSIQQARSEAIKRQRVVSLCASADPSAATPSCSATFGGWVLWEDGNSNGTIEAGEPIINSHAPLDSSVVLTGDSSIVSYAPNGFSRNTVGGVATLRVTKMCDPRGDGMQGSDYRKRVLTISRTGRPTIVKAVFSVAELQASLEAEGIAFDFSCPQGGGG